MWVNGARLADPTPGQYLKLDRVWSNDDSVRVEFDFSPRLVLGREQARGKAAVYLGPLLLAIDERFNPGIDMNALPGLPSSGLSVERAQAGAGHKKPWVLVRAKTNSGGSVLLCDFASAGTDNAHYAAWLPIEKPGKGKSKN